MLKKNRTASFETSRNFILQNNGGSSREKYFSMLLKLLQFSSYMIVIWTFF